MDRNISNHIVRVFDPNKDPSVAERLKVEQVKDPSVTAVNCHLRVGLIEMPEGTFCIDQDGTGDPLPLDSEGFAVNFYRTHKGDGGTEDTPFTRATFSLAECKACETGETLPVHEFMVREHFESSERVFVSARGDLRKILDEHRPGKKMAEEEFRRFEAWVRKAETSGCLDDSLQGRMAAMLFRHDLLGVANTEPFLMFHHDGRISICGVNDDEYSMEASAILEALPSCVSETDAIAAVRNAFRDPHCSEEVASPRGKCTWEDIGREVWLLWNAERSHG